MLYPPTYHSTAEYLSDALSFLKTFQWLYNYTNTHIVANDIFANFPMDWKSYFNCFSYQQVNCIPSGKFTEGNNCPESLINYIETLNKLKFICNDDILQCDYKLSHNSGLSKKKVHEILALAPLVDQICRENSVDFVVDVGSGLGYLSHLLHMKYDYSVLGIDCLPQYVRQAYENQEKYYPKSKSFVKFCEHFIDEDSSEQIKCMIQENSPEIRDCCLTGLHACADLSITILDLFHKLDFVKCLVIMPCCYHRIKVEEEQEHCETFKNFPASKIFKDISEKLETKRFLRKPFLRLACQQTEQSFANMTKEDHDRHSRNCFYRALLQATAQEENCHVARLKRKSGKLNASSDASQDFRDYLNNLGTTHRLVPMDTTETSQGKDITSDDFREKMDRKFDEQKENLYLVEVLAGLQAGLQKLCENLVLLDRVEFLKEKGYDCYIKRVTVDSISPRCYAIVACKK